MLADAEVIKTAMWRREVHTIDEVTNLCNVDAMADVSRCKDTDAEVIKAAM
jgi:hypothetical protein